MCFYKKNNLKIKSVLKKFTLEVVSKQVLLEAKGMHEIGCLRRVYKVRRTEILRQIIEPPTL